MADLKTGAQVYLRASPGNTGTVTRTSPAGFRITWHDPARKRGAPRLRTSFPWSLAPSFTAGRPPEEL